MEFNPLLKRWDIGGTSVGENPDIKSPIRLGRHSVSVDPIHFVFYTEEEVHEAMDNAVVTVKNFGATPHAWLVQKPEFDPQVGAWLATLVLVGEMDGGVFVRYDYQDKKAVLLSASLVKKA